MIKLNILLAVLIIFLTGCASAPPASTAAMEIGESQEHAAVVDSDPVANSTDLPDLKQPESDRSDHDLPYFRHEPEVSLFKSGQQPLSEETIKSIISSRVVLPQKGHLAIKIYPGTEGASFMNYGDDYLRSEVYLKTKQEYINTLSQKLLNSNRIVAVTLVPSLLTPKDAALPVLREAGVRLQADLLLVFRINSNIYSQDKLSVKDEVKAYSTCEAVILDTKTGLIPFTTIVTKENAQMKEAADSDLNETKRRAEKKAVSASLNALADEVVKFFKSVP